MVYNSDASEIDTSAAEAFEKFLVPTIFGPWSKAMVNHAEAKVGDSFLDVGCGSGAAARYAKSIVGKFGSVSAIDLNEGMIAFAQMLDKNNEIDWQKGDVTDMPYKDQSFNIVAGNQLLQFLPDKDKGLKEMKRVLKQGGKLALTIYCPKNKNPAHEAIAKALENNGVASKAVTHPFSFGDPILIGDLIQKAGFRDISVVRKQMDSYFNSAEHFIESLAAGGPSSRHALEQLDSSGLKKLKAEVTKSLTEFVDPNKGLRVITTANLALATA